MERTLLLLKLAFMLCWNYVPMNRLPCLPLSAISRMPHSTLPPPPLCPDICCQYGPAPLQLRQEAQAAEMHSNHFIFLSSHKPQPLHTPSVFFSVHVNVYASLCVAEISMLCTMPSLSHDFPRQLIWHWGKDRCHDQHLYKKLCRWIPIC